MTDIGNKNNSTVQYDINIYTAPSSPKMSNKGTRNL